MTSKAKQLATLSRLTGMVADTHLSRLQQAQAEVSRIRAAINRLDSAALASDRAMTHDYRCMNGAEMRWRKWQEKERARYQRALARALVREAALKRETAQAVGRNNVVNKLSKQHSR